MPTPAQKKRANERDRQWCAANPERKAAINKRYKDKMRAREAEARAKPQISDEELERRLEARFAE